MDSSVFESAYVASGADKYSYSPPDVNTPPTTWPTLQALINNGTRLVTFVASLATENLTDVPYLMDEFVFLFENNYDVTSAGNFSCQPDRPTEVKNDASTAVSSNRLPMMNHFLDTMEALSIEIPNADAANVTNGASGAGTGNLGDFATECATLFGRNPTYFLVDFFNVGPAIETVDLMNGVTDPVGRTNLSTSASTISADSLENGAVGAINSLATIAKTGVAVSVATWIWNSGDWSDALGAFEL
jgi:hypothetical protein